MPASTYHRVCKSASVLIHRAAVVTGLTLTLVIVLNEFSIATEPVDGKDGKDGKSADVDSEHFFESRIRPVLIKHCYECHSSEARELGGSLTLDSPDGMMSGGDSGPAITPGNASGSVLISALKYESSEMPPQGQLPGSVIEDFEKWIDQGAFDPRQSDPVSIARPAGIDVDQGRQFWAFQPLQQNQTLAHPPSIDGFLDAKLSESGLSANEPAQADVRLRRLAFDLTGLPPSLDLQQAWLADPSPMHWVRIVDELLASRGFGEHWARHWMDVARYADSNGSDFNATFHEAYRYRNYLIESFASDRPFDQMVHQQIAGDLLPFESHQERHDNLVASTFLMLGTKMLSERDKAKLTLDVVDEQIDTMGRVFLGMTLGCARCHDHKFDPIPTEDYYSLAGIFKSTVTLKGESQKYVSTWNRQLLPTSEEHRDAVAQHKKQLATLKKEIDRKSKQLQDLKNRQLDRYAGTIVDDAQATKSGHWIESTFVKDFVGVGYVHDNNSAKGEASIRFEARLPADGRYQLRIAYSGQASRAANVPVSIETADGLIGIKLDQRSVQAPPMWSTLGTFRFLSSKPAAVTIRNDGTQGYVIADAVQFLRVDDSGKSIESESTPTAAADDQMQMVEAELKRLRADEKTLRQNTPPALPEAMAPSDASADQVADSPVHIRGELHNLGEVIPRGFLQVCSSGNTQISKPSGSGRLELAAWLTDPDHPLVARVYVNRVWMHLMGEGLVRTVDNFGSRGERPTHPELLDFLAADFIREGWHTKSLVRAIVLSEAYSRSSRFDAEKAEVDAENRLLWRMHRRRLPAESIRDAMLTAAGLLDRSPKDEPMKDRGVLVSKNNGDSRASFDDLSQPQRSVYLPTVRGYMPAMLTALDVADPDLLVGRRPTTNVPAQALVLINSPEIQDWAAATAARITGLTSSIDEQIALLFHLCLHRQATADDHALMHSLLLPEQAISPEQAMSEVSRGFNRVDSAILNRAVLGHRPVTVDQWREIIAAVFASTEFRLLD